MALQVNHGDAEADAGNLGSAENSEISQDLGISQMQVNSGLGDFDGILNELEFVVFFDGDLNDDGILEDFDIS